MRGKCSLLGLCVIFLMLHDRGCLSLNSEGLALLDFRSRVENDPFGAFENWDPEDADPCSWSGVSCDDAGNVQMLDLKEQSLEGMLTPELGKLSHLRALVLRENNFTGVIPKEIGELTMLELLDLRCNNLDGTVPPEIGDMLLLKCLLLCDNNFQDNAPSWAENTNILSDLNLSCDKSKIGLWCKFEMGSSHVLEKRHGDNLSTDFVELYVKQTIHVANSFRRQLLQETHNFHAISVRSSSPQGDVMVPSTGSGSFPAVPSSNSGNSTLKQPSLPAMPSSPDMSSGHAPGSASSSKGSGNWEYILIILGAILLLTLSAAMLLLFRHKGSGTIGPWKTGLSGQLQKAFVTGVPKLNRADLEAACEDFSNIIHTYEDHTIFKGTLSSGVEIAVVSTAIKSANDWSEKSELSFRKKIDTLSRVNHKNFVNLLGYCEENPPFMRMMVFEYAPNGTLFDHLHVKDYEPIDWNARMRILMGIAYCLQHMHHDVKPPVVLAGLHSNSIFVTDDFAAKIADIGMSYVAPTKQRVSGDDEKDLIETPSGDPESDVYSFGILMLEIISGKIPYSEEGSIVDWAAQHFEGERNLSAMVDSTLKLSNDNELEIICEVVQDCICDDPKKRPTMKEVTSALREVLGLTPEAACPRASPLWWAELEILSVEAS